MGGLGSAIHFVRGIAFGVICEHKDDNDSTV
jgi:hypothetical protein